MKIVIVATKGSARDNQHFAGENANPKHTRHAQIQRELIPPRKSKESGVHSPSKKKCWHRDCLREYLSTETCTLVAQTLHDVYKHNTKKRPIVLNAT